MSRETPDLLPEVAARPGPNSAASGMWVDAGPGRSRFAGRLHRLGIQARIMLYVSVGLAAMVGLLLFFGLRALDDATSLVFEGRLNTARTVALIVERDLDHVATDVAAASEGWSSDPADLRPEVGELMKLLSLSGSFPFFHGAGVLLLDDEGNALEAVSWPLPLALHFDGRGAGPGSYVVLQVPETPGGEPGFAILAVDLENDSVASRALVLLKAHNSSAPFFPTAYQVAGDLSSEGGSDSGGAFHLEVIGPDGVVRLGIGEDEHPGGLSSHFAAISDLGSIDDAIVLRHSVQERGGAVDHVMAVVPMVESLTLILEQPVDVALALPLRVRRQLLLWSVIGFLVALILAWLTTGAVVRPIRELTAAAQRMADGDLESPVTVTARDEVGALAESLESMRSQTGRAYLAVENANRGLESRVRERTAELGVLLEMLISAQEEERLRLARELHDDTAQNIGALAIALDRARDAPSRADADLHLSRAKELVTGLLQDLRRLILDLRPMVLDDMGLISAVRWYAESHLETHGIEWTMDVVGSGDRLPPDIETALFRIVQEAVSNVIKHAEATRVELAVAIGGGTASISVQDDGVGFDTSAHRSLDAQGHHVGIAGMRERVALLRGELELYSTPGEGTVIRVVVPVSGEKRMPA